MLRMLPWYQKTTWMLHSVATASLRCYSMGCDLIASGQWQQRPCRASMPLSVLKWLAYIIRSGTKSMKAADLGLLQALQLLWNVHH